MTKQSRWLVVLLLIAPIPVASLSRAYAQAQPSHEQMWKEFLAWLPKAPSVDGPPSTLFIAYRDMLIKTGISTEDADQRLDVLRRLHRERPDAWRVMFNIIYASEKPGFATEPNALSLISTIEGRKSGRALTSAWGKGATPSFSR